MPTFIRRIVAFILCTATLLNSQDIRLSSILLKPKAFQTKWAELNNWDLEFFLTFRGRFSFRQQEISFSEFEF